ncbi:ash family protein [Salmonella enterica subsp. enterica serovar Corvallis]|nr:ash family protein [Salmonella enterica subsp. enterica serovar Corvallis]
MPKTRQERTLKNVDAFWRWRYGYFAAAKSAAGHLNPDNSVSAQHAPACFFVCSTCASQNYGGSGGAAERRAGF